MKFYIKITLIMLVTFYLINYNTYAQTKIKDIIKPIKLTAGNSATVMVSDLFYSDNYQIEFTPNLNITTNYDEEAKELKITADKNFEGMTILEFTHQKNLYHIPIISKKEIYYKFTFKPGKEYKQLTLFGSFNGWNRQDLPMIDDDGDGIFEAEVALEPGVYQYKFFGDGEEIVDPDNPVKVPNGFGDFNSVRTIEESDKSKLFLHVGVFNSTGDSYEYSFIAEYAEKSALTRENVFALLNNTQIDAGLINVNGSNISINLPKDRVSDDDLLRVTISKNGRVSNTQYVMLFNGKPVNGENFTWYDGIIYSIMIDRFNNGDQTLDKPIEYDSLFYKANYMGGDLQGIVDKLNEGYFDSLAVNTIWISPVYDNPNEPFKEYPAPNRYYTGYHGYWPINPEKVEEHFGDLEKLKELVATAHNHNIKILLDFVSNHVHEQHPWFKDHRNWFGQLELPDGRLNLRFWDEFRLTTWFEPYLPSFDYIGAPEAIEAITNNAVWWLKETGADGFRHDAVKHVPNEFWRALNQKLKRELGSERKIDIYQIGETFGSYDLISSYVNNGQLHAQFNFNLYDAALPTFLKHDASFYGLDKEMHKTFSVYGNLHLMGNIMDSHDKNRFMAFADGDLDVSQWSAAEVGWNNPPQVDNPENYKKLILYMAYMNTIPGLPVIYYGSEFGMTGASDPDNRRMMRFGDQLSSGEINTLNEVRKIVNLRKEHTALRFGDFYTLQADENIYAYTRSDMNERLLVMINKSSEMQSVKLELPLYFTKTNEVQDLTSGKVSSSNESINIAPMSYKIYKIL